MKDKHRLAWSLLGMTASFSAVMPAAGAGAQDSGGDGLPDAVDERLDTDGNFETTEGLDLIWKLQADPANVVFSSPKAELHGLSYYV